jgi:hypothetical protein
MIQMGSILSAVTDKKYRKALELNAQKLAEVMDDLEDEKNAAGISRELRLVLQALGIDEDEEKAKAVTSGKTNTWDS